MRYIDLNVLSTDIKPKSDFEYDKLPITSGSINDIACRFDFSEDWEGLYSIVAVFKGSGYTRAVLIEDNMAIIPSDCLLCPDSELLVGLVGTGSDGTPRENLRQITTEFFSLGIIIEGASYKEVNDTNDIDLTTQLIKKIEDVFVSEDERVANEAKRQEAELNRVQEDERRLHEHLTIMDEFSYLEARVGSVEGDMENKFNTIYTAVVELIDQHMQKSITDVEGVHGLRYYENTLQILTNDEWVDIVSTNIVD